MKKQILVKHDTPENWAKAVNFVPKAGEIIIYDGIMEDDKYLEPPKIKIGDGESTINNLPFIIIGKCVNNNILEL